MGSVVSGAVRVVVVDDDALVRNGLGLLLGTDPGIRVVGEAGDGLEAERVIQRERPDVVLMDIRMPRRDGLTATASILAAHPGLAILILTTFDADDDVLRALAAGARGFLLKDASPEELVQAVRTASEGRSILAPSVLERVMQLAAQQARRPDPALLAALDTLTPREREVAEAIARGASNADIAGALFLSIPTVKTHVGRVMAKLGVDSRVQVAVRMHELGLG
ncbi:response regulator [Arenivirga flava]|uniref:DNA-binding response regulator n=1 Tax=Arenivirga flava TaxID=1930060 RepID=A0AA37UU26_9MICO|nr:response regulator transcription factor [Arenivirga flava]GMA28492.1 DNA-binding response regulator [Arenivirga flava]